MSSAGIIIQAKRVVLLTWWLEKYKSFLIVIICCKLLLLLLFSCCDRNNQWELVLCGKYQLTLNKVHTHVTWNGTWQRISEYRVHIAIFRVSFHFLEKSSNNMNRSNQFVLHRKLSIQTKYIYLESKGNDYLLFNSQARIWLIPHIPWFYWFLIFIFLLILYNKVSHIAHTFCCCCWFVSVCFAMIASVCVCHYCSVRMQHVTNTQNYLIQSNRW